MRRVDGFPVARVAQVADEALEEAQRPGARHGARRVVTWQHGKDASHGVRHVGGREQGRCVWNRPRVDLH